MVLNTNHNYAKDGAGIQQAIRVSPLWGEGREFLQTHVATDSCRDMQVARTKKITAHISKHKTHNLNDNKF